MSTFYHRRNNKVILFKCDVMIGLIFSLGKQIHTPTYMEAGEIHSVVNVVKGVAWMLKSYTEFSIYLYSLHMAQLLNRTATRYLSQCD